VIGNNSGATGLYEIDGGTLHTADDGAGQFRVGRSGGSGTLRVGGTGVVIHEDALTLADGGAATEGILEMHGSTASLTVARLENTANGSSEMMHWSASAAGISPIVVNGTSGSNRVQLQDPAEVLENGGINGGDNLTGDGVALSLDLSALIGNHTLTLIDNQTSQSVVGFFEDAETMNLYEEGESISNTGFVGTVTISYVGGTGNDVTLSLVASTTVPGDHNADGAVDAADYVAWRKLGTNGTLGYSHWQNHFGMEAGNGNNTQVPEPAAWMLLVAGTIEVLGRSYRQLGRFSD
jgi:hypothetical protein